MIKRQVDAMYAYRQEGHTWDEVAKKFNGSREYIRAMVIDIFPDVVRFVPGKLNVPPIPGQFKKKNLDVSSMRQMRESGMSMKAIGRVMGCSGSTVCKRLQRDGMPTAKLQKRKAGKSRWVRMTDAEFSAFNERGGAVWLRSVLDGNSCYFHDQGEADRARAQA